MRKQEIYNMLPIGSIITLKDGQKKIMICGRFQKSIKSGKNYDYAACLYPEGVIKSDYLFLFNHEQIGTIYYRGYEDEEESKFLQEIVKRT